MTHLIANRFSVMGTAAEVHVIGGGQAVQVQARQRLESLEALWSRFRPDSDISTLNQFAGSSVPVAWETILLLQRSLVAARATDGRFDPTVGGALIAHGYDRTFTQIGDHAIDLTPLPEVDGSWPAIEIDPVSSTACLPHGTIFDPGGIGKGLAADLVAEELSPHAEGILINVGGDMRMCGTAPDAAGWVVSVDDPFQAGAEMARLAIPHGAVATSSSQHRVWTTAEGVAHHIIDPRTGRPAGTGVAAVTVVAAEAWWAEVQATSLFLLGPEGIDHCEPDVEAVMTLTDGSVHATAAFAAVLP